MKFNYNKEREHLSTKLARLRQKELQEQKKKDDNSKLINLVKDFTEFKNVNKTVLTKLINRIEVFENKKVKIHYNFKKPY